MYLLTFCSPLCQYSLEIPLWKPAKILREHIEITGQKAFWGATPSMPGVLMQIGPDDPEAPALVGAFSQGLAESGWVIGRNARIDYRWFQGSAEAARAYAAELLALTPDLILASGTHGAIACQSALDRDPRSASNRDPLERRVLAVALAPSELAGVAETARARVGL
jgi:hypothetical protein